LCVKSNNANFFRAQAANSALKGNLAMIINDFINPLPGVNRAKVLIAYSETDETGKIQVSKNYLFYSLWLLNYLWR